MSEPISPIEGKDVVCTWKEGPDGTLLVSAAIHVRVESRVHSVCAHSLSAREEATIGVRRHLDTKLYGGVHALSHELEQAFQQYCMEPQFSPEGDEADRRIRDLIEALKRYGADTVIPIHERGAR